MTVRTPVGVVGKQRRITLKADIKKELVRQRRAAAAGRYKPEQVSLLLVAEAPPSDDDRYFYFDDVASNDWLFLGVTEMLLGRRPPRSEKAKALAELRDMGVFLIDLKLDPVDGSALESYASDLVSRCRALNPGRIILIKAPVFDAAYKYLKDSGLPVVNKRVYFPSTGRQKDFRRQFKEALRIGI